MIGRGSGTESLPYGARSRSLTLRSARRPSQGGHGRRLAAAIENEKRPPRGEAAAIVPLTHGTYQIFTRSAGARYILSPGFTLNAFMNASLFVSGTNARAIPGECGLVSS